MKNDINLIPFARVSNYLKKNSFSITHKNEILSNIIKKLPLEIYLLDPKKNILTQPEVQDLLKLEKTNINSKIDFWKCKLIKVWSLKKEKAFIEIDFENFANILTDIKGFWICLEEKNFIKISPNDYIYYNYSKMPVYQKKVKVGEIKNFFHNGANGVWVINYFGKSQIENENNIKEILVPDIAEFVKLNDTKEYLEIEEIEYFL